MIDEKTSQLSEVRAYITLKGNDFDVNEITKYLNVQPNKVNIKGETLRMDNTPFTFSSWIFGVYDPVPSFDINNQLKSLLAIFHDKVDQVVCLKTKYNLEICINICIEILGDNTPAIYFETETLNFIHAIQAEIDIDLYAFK